MNKTELSPEAREARNRYAREWRKKNPERSAEITARYWQRKAEQLKQAAEQQEQDV